jgi:uncharacterized protein YaiL (DUF2058 family)
MASEMAAQEAALQSSVVGASGEEAEHQRCMKINQQWNEQVAKEREVRLAKEREAKMEQILTELQQEETQKTQRMAEIKQLIAAEKVCYFTVPKLCQSGPYGMPKHMLRVDNSFTVFH